MPWLPELFSAPALERIQEKWDRALVTVPFFDGLMTGELDAMLESFAGAPELHHPVRGRIKGVRAFSKFVVETRAWLSQSGSSVEDLDHVIRGGRRGCGEVVLHLEEASGRVSLPVAIVADKEPGGQIDELRMYYSSWPLTGRHANRPPLLQADPEVGTVSDLMKQIRATEVTKAAVQYQGVLTSGGPVKMRPGKGKKGVGPPPAKVSVQDMVTEIRTKFDITDEEALYIRQVTEEKVADAAIGITVKAHRNDWLYLEGPYRGQVNEDIQTTYDDHGRYDELADPKYTDTGGIFDIMAITVIQTHLAAP